LKKIEEAAGVTNSSEFRKSLAHNVQYRKEEYNKEDGYYDYLAKKLIEENVTFRRAIENYAIKELLPRQVNDVSTAYSPMNKELIAGLKKLDYCNACANHAVQLAVQMRSSE